MTAPLSQRVGIIGGMGNEAMVDLLLKMSEYQQNDKRPFIAFGNSRLAYKPEEAIQSWLPTDQPTLRKYDTTYYTLCFMQHLGVNAMGLACNSGHKHFRDRLPEVQVNFVDMLKRTARSLEGTKDTVLVLGVSSLVESGIYQDALAEFGVQSTRSSPENQEKVMRAIYDTTFGIKTAQITEQAENLLCAVITEETTLNHCSKVVLGCTELPLAITPESCKRFKELGMIPQHIEVIDASRVLAEALSIESGERHRLTTPLSECKRPNTDWYPPVAFKVSSLEEAARIQQEIFNFTRTFLAKRGKNITGSYLHLPTLFFSDTEADVENKLTEMGICVHEEHATLSHFMGTELTAFFADLDLQ